MRQIFENRQLIFQEIQVLDRKTVFSHRRRVLPGPSNALLPKGETFAEVEAPRAESEQ